MTSRSCLKCRITAMQRQSMAHCILRKIIANSVYCLGFDFWRLLLIAKVYVQIHHQHVNSGFNGQVNDITHITPLWSLVFLRIPRKQLSIFCFGHVMKEWVTWVTWRPPLMAQYRDRLCIWPLLYVFIVLLKIPPKIFQTELVKISEWW